MKNFSNDNDRKLASDEIMFFENDEGPEKKKNSSWKISAVVLVIVGMVITASVVARGGREINDKPSASNVLPTKPPASPSATNTIPDINTDIIVHYADITHDGVDEKIVVDLRDSNNYKNDGYEYSVNVYYLNYGWEELIKEYKIGKNYGSWGGVYLYEKDGLYYLMSRDPDPFHGNPFLEYSVYYFELDGDDFKCVYLDSEKLDFSKLHNKSQLREYYDKVDSYVSKSYVILDTYEEVCFSRSKMIRNTYFSYEWYQNIINKMLDYYRFYYVTTYYIDVTHDEIDEKIVVDRSKSMEGAYIDAFSVDDSQEKLIWSYFMPYGNCAGMCIFEEDSKDYFFIGHGIKIYFWIMLITMRFFH